MGMATQSSSEKLKSFDAVCNVTRSQELQGRERDDDGTELRREKIQNFESREQGTPRRENRGRRTGRRMRRQSGQSELATRAPRRVRVWASGEVATGESFIEAKAGCGWGRGVVWSFGWCVCEEFCSGVTWQG